jgi:ribosomal protein S7
LLVEIKGILRTIGARTYRALDEAIQKAYQQFPLKTFTIGVLTAVTVLHLFEKRYNAVSIKNLVSFVERRKFSKSKSTLAIHYS